MKCKHMFNHNKVAWTIQLDLFISLGLGNLEAKAKSLGRYVGKFRLG